VEQWECDYKECLATWCRRSNPLTIFDVKTIAQRRGLDHNLVDSGIKTYAARSDIEAMGIKTDIVLLDCGEVVDMIFDSNRVVCW